jgi:hypothetical protein
MIISITITYEVYNELIFNGVELKAAEELD